MSAHCYFLRWNRPQRTCPVSWHACSIPSVHLISTFDSGRSSKELRRAFAIPALGDLRNRLLALADPDKTSRAVMDFLSFRLPESGNREHLRNCLSDLCNPNNEIWLQIPPHKKIALYNGLFQFLIRMPLAFNPLNASLGNLVLAGAYLQSGRNFSFALNVLLLYFFIASRGDRRLNFLAGSQAETHRVITTAAREIPKTRG